MLCGRSSEHLLHAYSCTRPTRIEFNTLGHVASVLIVTNWQLLVIAFYCTPYAIMHDYND